MDLVKIAVMNLEEAKSLKGLLQSQGVQIVLNHDDASCNRGCSVTVEVHAKEADIPKVQAVYQQAYMKLLDGHDVDPEIINSVYDPAEASATCPACGTSFETSLSQCPECELVLG